MLRSLVVVLACVGLCACGSSSVASSSSPSVPPTPSPLGTPSASTQCPTAAAAGAALAITLPRPTSVSGGSSTLPAGAVLLVCNYHASTYNVIIERIENVDPSYISKFSDKFPVPYKAVRGVGDQARTFSVSIGGGRDNEGVVATKGRTLVAITATGTPSTLAQLEALASELL
jgi:hypothetical protein